MLSRLALRSAFLPRSVSAFSVTPIRGVTHIKNNDIPMASPTDAPERDHVNFPRIKFPDHHPPVRFLFIPDTWFTFFHNKTGVTGPYMLGFGFISFAISKELLLFYDHNITHLKIVILWLYIIYLTDLGQVLWHYFHKFLLKEQEDHYNEFWSKLVTDLEDAIKIEKSEVVNFEAASKDILTARRENVAIQLETVYRERALDVYNKVKRKLDYHVAIGTVVDRIKQKYMVDWVIDNVKASITPDQERETLKKCIADLQVLSAKV